jgi:hypothetical protein
MIAPKMAPAKTPAKTVTLAIASLAISVLPKAAKIIGLAAEETSHAA